jgi:hypothetical protein
MNAQEIQNILCQNICKGFLLYCNDHKINITQLFTNSKGKLSKQNVYAVARGSKKYLSSIALCYLAELLNFNTPTAFEQYYLNSKSN